MEYSFVEGRRSIVWGNEMQSMAPALRPTRPQGVCRNNVNKAFQTPTAAHIRKSDVGGAKF